MLKRNVRRKAQAVPAFKRNKYGLGERVQRPGMPETFRRELINRTGNKLIKPEE